MSERRSAPPEPSRREANKQRTKEALRKAALELCARNGYDATTIDEIAERAGVSSRTFFRYFPTKESALFAGEYRWFQAFTELYLAQPSSLSDVEAMRDTLVALAPSLTGVRRYLRLLEQAAGSSPTLRGRIQDRQEEDIVAVAEAVARRRGLAEPDTHARLLATVGIVTYRTCFREWLAGPARADPAQLIDRNFAALGELFAPAPPTRRRAGFTPAIGQNRVHRA